MQKKSRAPWDRIRKEVVADDWGPENVKVANDIYRRLAAISPGDWIEKEDLYAAHRGDDRERFGEQRPVPPRWHLRHGVHVAPGRRPRPRKGMAARR